MNTTDRLAAQRYALAYDSLSTSVAQAQSLADDLRVAMGALSSIDAYMKDPQISQADKKKVVLSALQKAPKTAAFVGLLIEAKRYSLLAEISARVDKLLEKRQNILRAAVVSAHPLSQVQQKNTCEALSSRYGKTIKAVFHTDESLLGGLTVVCNGEYIDGSVRGCLKKLQQELIK